MTQKNLLTLFGGDARTLLVDAALMAAPELSQLIDYQCVRPEHLQVSQQDRVFIHADGWAYCPAGRDAAKHTFLPTGGLDRRRVEGGVTRPSA